MRSSQRVGTRLGVFGVCFGCSFAEKCFRYCTKSWFVRIPEKTSELNMEADAAEFGTEHNLE
jgi:hypothetical protein